MCTSISYKNDDCFYFGRTLDYEKSFGEKVVITPRNYEFNFLNGENLKNHNSIIGMACVVDGYPLYYDAFNEKGLAISGLNFVDNAHYCKRKPNKINLAQFELIPYLLSKYESVLQVKKALNEINITNEAFSNKLEPAQLHWLISDEKECITLECVKEGIKVYQNPVGVLTNNPEFQVQMFCLNNYVNLSRKTPKNSFSDKIDLSLYSRGMGAIGLPGDLSSQSRFARAAFTKLNSVSRDGENNLSQFFHILGTVNQTRGCCEIESDEYEITLYTSCCDIKNGCYYYTTYDNSCISCVNMNNENLNTDRLIAYVLEKEQIVNYQN